MKKNYIIIGLALVIVLTSMLFCFTRIRPGEVGVLVNLFGSARGVEEKELSVGVHLVPPWKTLYLFPVFEQNHQWVGDDMFTFQTLEGLSVHAEIGITFNLVADRVHELFCKYRRGMDEITHLFIRNNIRDAINKAASRMTIEELYGSKKESFFKEVHSQVTLELEHLGFHISHIYIIGKFIVPDAVSNALDKKIEAIQRAQQRENELRESEAEAKKEVAKAEGFARSQMVKARAEADSRLLKARAEAEANNLLNKSLTKELIKWQTVNQWDGVLPRVMTGGESMLMLPVRDEEDK
jgi:regulator of protease activity HflC (stomatin/prohibitin superfamily)